MSLYYTSAAMTRLKGGVLPKAVLPCWCVFPGFGNEVAASLSMVEEQGSAPASTMNEDLRFLRQAAKFFDVLFCVVPAGYDFRSKNFGNPYGTKADGDAYFHDSVKVGLRCGGADALGQATPSDSEKILAYSAPSSFGYTSVTAEPVFVKLPVVPIPQFWSQSVGTLHVPASRRTTFHQAIDTEAFTLKLYLHGWETLPPGQSMKLVKRCFLVDAAAGFVYQRVLEELRAQLL